MKNRAEINKENCIELANKIKSFGYDVYIAEKGTYGFFTNGERLVSFQIDYFWFNFSSNHKSKGFGSGARLTNDEDCIQYKIEDWCTNEFLNKLLNSQQYRGNGGYFISWTTLKEHMDFYNSSSKYQLI